MESVIMWCGFLGSWFLFAGPVYQASLELRSEAREIDRIRALMPKPPRREWVSAWWWLLPPVKIILERSKANQFHQDYLTSLPDEEMQILVSFLNKSMGWVLVAGGAWLLAIKETYELIEHMHLSVGWYFFAVLLITGACLSYTASRNSRSEQLLSKNGA